MSIVAEPDNPMITRNYVTYLTSNSILLGAEFDKIISIVVVTLILALAIYRGHGGFWCVRSPAGAAQRDLARFFAPEIARAHHRGRAAGDGRRGRAARRRDSDDRHARLYHARAAPAAERSHRAC